MTALKIEGTPRWAERWQKRQRDIRSGSHLALLHKQLMSCMLNAVLGGTVCAESGHQPAGTHPRGVSVLENCVGSVTTSGLPCPAAYFMRNDNSTHHSSWCMPPGGADDGVLNGEHAGGCRVMLVKQLSLG